MRLIVTFIIYIITSVSFAQVEIDSARFSADSLTDFSNVIANENVDISCMTPPVGFDTSRFFNGYMSLYQGGMFRFVEYVGLSFNDYQKMIDKNVSSLENSEMKFISRENLVLETGIPLEFIKVQYSTPEEGYFGKEYYRYLVYTGVDNTLFIDIVYPISSNLDDAVLKSLKSIKYDK